MTEKAIAISAVVPIYNEAESLPELHARLSAELAGLAPDGAYEIVFADDGSDDATRQTIARLCARDERVRTVRFRRNVGKSLALMGGFRAARGAVVVQIDGDLQDRPEDIPGLLKTLESGFDMVNGRREKRNDTAIRRFGSRVFNFAIRRSIGLSLRDMNCGLKIYRREVVDAISIYGQYHRYIPVMAAMLGFKVGEHPVGNDPRKHGASRFVTFRYQGLFDLLSLLFLNRFGLSPMHFFGVVSLPMILLGLLVLGAMLAGQILFWLGFGPEFMVHNRPLLSYAIFLALFGGGVFLCGFVCDFVLHHLVRARMDGVLDLLIEKRGSAAAVRRRAAPE